MDQKDKNNILLRVTQINAVYLDTEIVKCLEEVLHDAVKYLPVSSFEVIITMFHFSNVIFL